MVQLLWWHLVPLSLAIVCSSTLLLDVGSAGHNLLREGEPHFINLGKPKNPFEQYLDERRAPSKDFLPAANARRGSTVYCISLRPIDVGLLISRVSSPM